MPVQFAQCTVAKAVEAGKVVEFNKTSCQILDRSGKSIRC